MSDVSQAHVLPAALATLAQVIPPDIELRFGTRLLPTFWGMLVGSSGSRKTVAVTLAREILQEVAPSAIGTQPESDVALIEALQRRPQQMILFSEFGSFLSSTASRSSYKSALRARLTEVWDGQPLRKEAKGSGITGTDRPQLSILAAVAPAFIEQNSTLEDWTNGFFPRFMVFFAERETEKLIPPPSWDPGKAYAVWQLQQVNRQKCGKLLGVSDEAGKYLQEWNAWVKGIYGPEMDRLVQLQGFTARAVVTAVRLAMILSFDSEVGQARQSNGAPWLIGVHEMKYACQIVQFHLHSLLHLVQQVALSPSEKLRRDVLTLLQMGPQTPGEVARGLTPKRMKRDVILMVETLLFEGLISEIKDSYGVTNLVLKT